MEMVVVVLKVIVLLRVVVVVVVVVIGVVVVYSCILLRTFVINTFQCRQCRLFMKLHYHFRRELYLEDRMSEIMHFQ